MALINCPECKDEISSEAEACPNCGYPVSSQKDNQTDYSTDHLKEDTRSGDEKGLGSKLNFLNLEGCSGCFIYVVLLFFVMALIGSLIPEGDNGDISQNNTNSDNGFSLSGAEVACRNLVKDRLKAPSTAEFSWDENSLKLGNKKVKVQSEVDAENSFGAKIRKEYTCIVKHTGGNHWRLQRLDLH